MQTFIVLSYLLTRYQRGRFVIRSFCLVTSVETGAVPSLFTNLYFSHKIVTKTIMEECPIVQVEQGQLQGKVVQNPSGKFFFSYQGIPYAKPPLGLLRFKAPQPAEPWDGIRDATSEGNVSAQIDHIIHKDFIGDENCLFLNVYTPTTDGAFLPVMVFLHGGGYRFGSGNTSMYGADYLVENDVVVVTLNYRCGALGFLSLNTAKVPGNAGLKDMVQALRWIRENIHNFGGNSRNITVFGESAGGAAVSVLTASPLTKGLISKAIIQSGNGLNSWAWQERPVDNAKALARQLGCDSEDIEEVLEFLTTTPVREIVEANEKLHPRSLLYEKSANIFAPVIEREFPGNEAVLTEAFLDVLASGRTAEIPVMIGSTTLEFGTDLTSEDLQVHIPVDLKIEKNSDEAFAIAEKIKQLYFKGEHVSVENIQGYYELLSDKLVNIDTHRYVKYLVHTSNKPTYYYRFDYVGELNVSRKVLFSLGLNHAAHMDELGYLFKNKFQDEVTPNSQDILTRERMVNLWTNFAKEGNPTPEENQLINVTWLPVTKDHLYYLNISNELSLDTNPRKENMEFWDNIYNKHFKIWEHPKVNKEEVAEKRYTIAVIESGEVPVTPTIKCDVVEEVTEVFQEKVEIIEEATPQEEEVAPRKEEEMTPHGEVPKTETHKVDSIEEQQAVKPLNGSVSNGLPKISFQMKTSNEIKYVGSANGTAKDVIRANDPPKDDLPQNIGVKKFVNFFENLGGKSN